MNISCKLRAARSTPSYPSGRQLQADKFVFTGLWQHVGVRCTQYTLTGCTGVTSHHALMPITRPQPNQLISNEILHTLLRFCVLSHKRESKGCNFMLFWKICHHKFRMHYIITRSPPFQLPVTFSDLLIFSIIFSHIHSITPTHYPVFVPNLHKK